MRPMKQPPSVESVACSALIVLLCLAVCAFAVKRFIDTTEPSYRNWEYIDIYVTESGYVRKCVIEAPSVLDALRCMDESGERFNRGATVRPCVTHRTRIVALERVP